MGVENRLNQDNNDEIETSSGVESGKSAREKLDALLKRIEEKGGIEGSQGRYTPDQIRAQVDLAFITRGKNLDKITNTDNLRDKLSAAIRERDEIDSRQSIDKKNNPIKWNDEAEDLQRLEEEDRANH